MRNYTYWDILSAIKRQGFVIYGMGGHAEKFYQVVKKSGAECNFIGYALSKIDDNCKDAKLITEYERDTLIIVAAHNKNADEMCITLKDNDFNNYIVIYPFLTELCFGAPKRTNVEMEIDSFLRTCKFGNYLSIYYLAIDYIAGYNSIGKDLYYKALSTVSKKETVDKRWEFLNERIHMYKTQNYDLETAIKVNLNEKFILDGSHRMMLAKYFDIKTIIADDFETSFDEYNKATYGIENRWNDKEIRHIYNQEEISIIINTKKEVLGQI